MRHYTTVLHSSDFRLSEYQEYVCVCLCVCVCLFCLGASSFKAKELRLKLMSGVGFSLSPYFLDPGEILNIASSHPCRQFDSGSPTGCQVCYFQGREEAMIYLISADTGSLSPLDMKH